MFVGIVKRGENDWRYLDDTSFPLSLGEEQLILTELTSSGADVVHYSRHECATISMNNEARELTAVVTYQSDCSMTIGSLCQLPKSKAANSITLLLLFYCI